jgi:hypothetical protein
MFLACENCQCTDPEGPKGAVSTCTSVTLQAMSAYSREMKIAAMCLTSSAHTERLSEKEAEAALQADLADERRSFFDCGYIVPCFSAFVNSAFSSIAEGENRRHMSDKLTA